jgi:SH3-like domain-containing protein
LSNPFFTENPRPMTGPTPARPPAPEPARRAAAVPLERRAAGRARSTAPIAARAGRWWRVLPLLLAAGASAAAPMVSVDRPIINLRSAPGTTSTVEWTLARGYPLKVIGQRRGWLHVRDFEDDTGWVLGRLTGHTPHVVVRVPVANLRGAPGTRARIVGRARYGDVLRTLDRREGWLRVRPDGGRAGWVARRLVWGW